MQNSASTPVFDNPTGEIEKRIFQLETEQERQINALEDSNDQYRFLLNSLGGFLAIIITAGGILQFLQFRREGARAAMGACLRDPMGAPSPPERTAGQVRTPTV
jgi:hypothetical protein